jgi:hypothetical protein
MFAFGVKLGPTKENNKDKASFRTGAKIIIGTEDK